MLLVSEVLNIGTLTIIVQRYAYVECLISRKCTFYMDLRFATLCSRDNIQFLAYKMTH